MQNISGLTTTNCSYDGRQVPSIIGLKRRLTRRFLDSKNREQLKNCGVTLLTILGVSSIFLAGTYFFLCQLARYGW